MTTIMEQLESGGHKTLSDRRPVMEIVGEKLLELYKKFKKLTEGGAVEITITFKPDLSIRYRPSTLTKMVEDILIKYRTKARFNIILVGEYSPTGLYHMHGSIISDGRMLNTIGNKLRREIGRTEIKNIRNTNNWIYYTFKPSPRDEIGYKSDDGDIKLRKLIDSEIIDIQ